MPRSFFVMLLIGFSKVDTPDLFFSDMALTSSSNTCFFLRIVLNTLSLLYKTKSPDLSVFFDLTTEIPAIDSSTRWQTSIVICFIIVYQSITMKVVCQVVCSGKFFLKMLLRLLSR